MWKENLIALKEKSGKNLKKIEKETNIPERTLIRIFSTKKDDIKRGHSFSTIIPIVNCLGGSLDEIFADTNAIVGSKSFIEMQDKIKILQAEKDIAVDEHATLKAENANLKDQVKMLSSKIELLEMKLAHKEELLVVHNYYNKLLK